MSPTIVIIGGLFILALVSGMVGLGVAFAALPFLGFFMPDLVHQVQPLSLLLNGVTALFAAAGFARSGLVDWRQALPLCVVTTLAAPLGSWAAQVIPQLIIWYLYFAAVLYLAYRLFKPAKPGCDHPRYKLLLAWAVPISVLSGLLGVGPGFLLLPTMILLCVEPKHAAAMTAVAVTPPSFSALVTAPAIRALRCATDDAAGTGRSGGIVPRRAANESLSARHPSKTALWGADRAEDRLQNLHAATMRFLP